MIRVALCIAGQVRDDDLYFGGLSGLAMELDAQVFISTWRNRGFKKTGALNFGQLVHIFGRTFASALPRRFVGRLRFENVFPSFAAELDRRIGARLEPVTPEQLLARFPGAVADIEDDDLLSLDAVVATDDKNSLRMLYKIWRCNELKRRFEKRNGTRFDIVIRCRPDVVPSSPPADLRAEITAPDRRLIMVSGGREGFTDDRAAISNSAVADHYAGLFGQIVQAPARKWAGIHSELHQHLHSASVESRVLRPQRNLTAVPARQAESRDILLGLIRDRKVDARGYDDRELAILHDMMLAAHHAEAGQNDQAAEALRRIEWEPARSSRETTDLASAFFAVFAELCRRRGEHRDAYVATLLSWAIVGKRAIVPASVIDSRVRDAVKLMVQGTDPHTVSAQLTWETAARHLRAKDLPAPLRLAAARAFNGPLTIVAKEVLAFLRDQHVGSASHPVGTEGGVAGRIQPDA